MLISRFTKVGYRVFRQLHCVGFLSGPKSLAGNRGCIQLLADRRVFHNSYMQRFRPFSESTASTSQQDNEAKQTITVIFVSKDGEEKRIKVPVGMSMLEAAHQNDIELEGACEASLACSTCHVIVTDTEYYNKLEEPTDEENDMLDLAFGLTETSRLGCQVIATPELDGIRLAIPAATRNFAVDGFVPKPH
ncbi:PREDICTED: uncharacterized protein LOC104823133 [Tarenaya hassleriana]|nr:PREDICTED: uncharacterized protein LOC104823133 [Tarenaya hassleriana]